MLEELHRRGVREIPGVPGDYILPFVRELQDFDGMENMAMVAEGDAAWAANLIGRKQLSACYATFMVGCLNMLNGVCDATKNLGASSLVIIGGEVALADRGADYILHHETEASSCSMQEEIFQMLLGNEYAKSITDISTAAKDIAWLITLAHEEHRPVYIGIPKDLWDMRIKKSSFSAGRKKNAEISLLPHNVNKAKERIECASRPVILVGTRAERFGLVPLLQRFAKKYGIPVAAAYHGRGAYPPNDPFFIGTYAAQASFPPDIQKIVEDSDCLIKVGVVDCDMAYGLRPPRLGEGDIVMEAGEVSRVFLEHLIEAREFRKDPSYPRSFSYRMNTDTYCYFSEPLDNSRAIAISDISPIIHQTLQDYPDTPIVADIGNAMAIPVVAVGGYYTSAYGAMGVTVGAIGLEKAFGERPLVIVGDGAFGMWSLGSILTLRKYGSKQVIIVLNNEGWGMLRPIAGNVPYLDIPSGNFEKLTEVAGCGLGFRVETPAQFAHALRESFAADTFSITNVILQKDDTADTIRRFMTT